MVPMYHLYAYDRPRHRRHDNQQYNLGMPLHDVPTLLPVGHTSRDYMPWKSFQPASDIALTLKAEREKFQVNLDVQYFTPDEIVVKTVDGFIIVQAKHEEKKDHCGYVSRSFTRRYALPAGVAAELLTSKLSLDGVLTVSAPMKEPPKTAAERVVPIIQTGPVKKQAEGDDSEKVENAEKN